jgi:hypothetical protein
MGAARPGSVAQTGGTKLNGFLLLPTQRASHLELLSDSGLARRENTAKLERGDVQPSRSHGRDCDRARAEATATYCGHSAARCAVGAIGCKAPRHRWHLRQRRHFRICNSQNLKGRSGFESHPLRQLPRLRLGRRPLGRDCDGHWASGVASATKTESHPLRQPSLTLANQCVSFG